MKIIKSYVQNSKNERVYDIKIGKQELELIRKIADHQRLQLPKYFEFMPARARLHDIVKKIDKQFELDKQE